MSITHYTSSVDSLVGILDHGFVWVHNKRHLIESFLPERSSQNREPQQFGMISFTDLSPLQVDREHSKHGQFGITMTLDWARRHQADRVIYVADEGPVFDAWKSLFRMGFQDLVEKIRDPNDQGSWMGYENKAVASSVVGSMLWAYLLQLYEFMEPAVHAHESEWRVVRDIPIYSDIMSPEETVRSALPPRGWGEIIHVLKIKPIDIQNLICPKEFEKDLLDSLPPSFEEVPIKTFQSMPPNEANTTPACLKGVRDYIVRMWKFK